MLKAKKKLTRKEIKQDKFVTYYLKVIDFYKVYTKEVIYGLVAIAGLIALTFYIINSKQAAEQKAAVELARGRAAFQNGNYDVAVDILTALTSDFSGTRGAGMGTIYLAKAFMGKKQYDKAEEAFKKYLDDYNDDSILSLAAATGIAASYDDRGDYQKAGELYEKAAKDFKDSFKAPELLLSAGRCYKMAGQAEKAKQVLDQLISDYPKSQLVSEAKLYLAEIRPS